MNQKIDNFEVVGIVDGDEILIRAKLLELFNVNKNNCFYVSPPKNLDKNGKLIDLELNRGIKACDIVFEDVCNYEVVDDFLEFAKEYDEKFSTENLERELKSCKNPLRKQQIQREIQELKRCYTNKR